MTGKLERNKKKIIVVGIIVILIILFVNMITPFHIDKSEVNEVFVRGLGEEAELHSDKEIEDAIKVAESIAAIIGSDSLSEQISGHTPDAEFTFYDKEGKAIHEIELNGNAIWYNGNWYKSLGSIELECKKIEQLCKKYEKVNEENEETVESDGRLSQYKAFLQGEISSKSKEKEPRYLDSFCFDSNPKNHKIKYALFDMTGDGEPELHVHTGDTYSIHTIENNQLIVWYDGDRHGKPLNNGAILEKVESTGVHYGYTVFNSKGEKVLSVGFSKPPKGAIWSGYKYSFDTGNGDVELSKKEWEKLTKPFLSVGSDKIVWKDISDLDF